jgi:ATP-dependent Clp protease ATP-binding subunit ClpA
MIEENPNCVLLLDEIEKAAPEVFQLLLQIMDDAKLSSSSGKKSVDFSNVILIMTSNLGAQSSEKQAIGFVNDSKADEDTKAAKEFFTPEFRNRLDSIVRFNRLGLDHILLIVDKVIEEVNALAVKKNVRVKVSHEAKKWLADKGFDPLMGARPLKRVISDEIKKPLSREMLFGELRDGGSAHVMAVDDKLEIEYRPANSETDFEIPDLEGVNM